MVGGRAMRRRDARNGEGSGMGRAFVEVGAVVVGLYASGRVGCIDVECVQVCADAIDGAEVLWIAYQLRTL